jgi:type II secretory pathway pseudopilin PulG
MPLLSLSRDERGFTMVTVIITMLIVMMLSIAALSAAQNDLPAGKKDTDRKIAYAAAEAGVQYYLYHLVDDPIYWSRCTTVGGPVNNPWNGSATRKWAEVAGSTRARYTIELMPANGAVDCDTAHPDATMIDTNAGTFRIRVTGQALNLDGVTGVKRSIVVNLRRESLLDYVYFTDKEVLDPSLYAVYTGGKTTNRLVGGSDDVKQWAPTACARYYGNNAAVGNRAAQLFSGAGGASLKTGLLDGTTWRRFSLNCLEIQFATSDVVKGPFHTNDEIFCQSGSSTGPKFGRLPSERVEVATAGQTAAAPTGYRGCTPYVNTGTVVSKPAAGTLKTKADGVGTLDLPLTNKQLENETAADYSFVGPTKVVMNGSRMTITGKRKDGTQLTNSDQPLPADGVLFVGRTASEVCPPYNPIATYTSPDSCGNLEIKGNYSVNVTFTAEDDIIINGDTTRVANSEALLGLIATGFVRVYHPVTTPVFTVAPTGTGTVTSVNANCSNSASSSGIQIDASILALTHSFIVDNYYCGNGLGTLTVNGAIVQAYRGAVGTAAGNGFGTKNYTYDNRLKYRSPPKFLDPVAAAWHTQTYNEQIPAR